MQLIRGQHNLRPRHRGTVATIGNFDGAHLGHQAVFHALKERARALDLPTTVIIFEPQPLEFFHCDAAPARLTRLREKLQILAECNIDQVLVLEFNRHLADMPPTLFIDQVLVDGLGIRHLFVGDDFRFGKGREGSFDLLVSTGRADGFTVENLHTVELDDDRISSTRIRQALARGDFDEAGACLGRAYQICGRVGHGNKKGRTIGFPTLNIDLHRRVSPLSGVFAVRVHGLEAGALPGVANVGNRPTADCGQRQLLEVHLFDFSRQVYGEHISVEFVRRLRDERKFASFAELRQQIQSDALAARHILGI